MSKYETDYAGLTINAYKFIKDCRCADIHGVVIDDNGAFVFSALRFSVKTAYDVFIILTYHF